MNQRTFELDDEAQNLYEQLDGIDDSRVFYINEQQMLNEWRKAMVEFAYHLSLILNNYRLSDVFVKNKKDFLPLLERLDRMAEILVRDPEHKLTIRQRGISLVQEGSGRAEKTAYDYVISCGDCVIDRPYLNYLIKNRLMDDPSLIRKLERAFQFFSLTDILIIEISMYGWSPEDREQASACLSYWARFVNDTAKKTDAVILDAEGAPDPNLTLLARLNRFKLENFQRLVKQIHKRYLK